MVCNKMIHTDEILYLFLKNNLRRIPITTKKNPIEIFIFSDTTYIK